MKAKRSKSSMSSGLPRVFVTVRGAKYLRCKRRSDKSDKHPKHVEWLLNTILIVDDDDDDAADDDDDDDDDDDAAAADDNNNHD